MDSQFAFKVPKKTDEKPSSEAAKLPASNIFSTKQPSSNPFKFFAPKNGSQPAEPKAANPFISNSKPSFLSSSITKPSLLRDAFKDKKSMFNDSTFRTSGQGAAKASVFKDRSKASMFKSQQGNFSARDGAAQEKTKTSIPSLMQKRLAPLAEPKERGRSLSPFGDDASPERPRRRAFERIEKENPFSLVRHPPSSLSHANEKSSALKDQGSEIKPFNKTKLLADGAMSRDVQNILQSFSELQRRNCPDDYSRYLVLDERDKLLYRLRAENDKNSPQVGKRLVTGTLNSMCAEKERYVRIVQNRIASYELDEKGKTDPNRLVKEYARSAADQEKPLPHELRQPGMLRYSMDYLLTNILDSVPDSEEIAGWYNFLWDRTRAIRKEVTQLMMSNELAVSLLESCTRFHIVCSYLLCAQDLEKFDQKMNTENLGKSLQTLRHLYEDLAKKGVYCESEAEFRAYDVLLHLQDSNVLRQVLSYQKSVREAPHVRLAIQLASAMQTNNFARFFRLLRVKGSYLQCCVCHRFFSEVRRKALVTMTRSYGRNTSFRIQYLSNVLAFDDENNALNILGEHGIYASDMNSEEVDFTREHMNTDAEPPLVTYAWIDCKRVGLLSETVNGRPVVSNGLIPEISDSFDADGYYCKDPILKQYLCEYRNFKAENTRSVLEVSPQKTLPTVPSVPVVDLVAAKKLEEERARREEEERVRKLKKEQELRRAEEERQRRIIETQRRAEEAEREARLAAEQQERERKEKLRGRITRLVPELYETMEVEVVEKQLKKIISEELLRNKNGRQLGTAFVQSTGHQLITTVVDKHLRNILKTMLKERKKEIDRGLSAHKERLSQLWLKQFWVQWRNQVEARKEARRTRANEWNQFTPNWKSSLCLPDLYLRSPDTKPTAVAQSPLTTKQRLALADLRRNMTYRIMRTAFDKWRHNAKEKGLERRQFKILKQAHHSFSLRRPHGAEGVDVNSLRRKNPSRDASPVRKTARLSLEESFTFPMVPFDFYEEDMNDSYVPNPLETSLVTDDDLAIARKELERTSIAMPSRRSYDEWNSTAMSAEEATALEEAKHETVELISECRSSTKRREELQQRAANLAATLRSHQSMMNIHLEDIIRKQNFN